MCVIYMLLLLCGTPEHIIVLCNFVFLRLIYLCKCVLYQINDSEV